MSATQKEIAEKAQVSRSLVGRVLSGDTSVRVSADKRQHIFDIAGAVGYEPNLIARNLRRGKSHAVIAVCQYIASNPREESTHGVLETLAAGLAAVGYELKVRAFESMDDILAGIDKIVSTSACDALVIWLENEHGERPGIAVEKHGLPFITVGHYEEHLNWCQVDFDHKRMMHLAVQSLVSMGRTRLAYFGFDNLHNYAGRLQSGYREAVLELTGIPPVEQNIYRVDNSLEVTEAIVEQWLTLPQDEQITGVVIGAGARTWLAIELALARHGRRIGLQRGDLAVVGQRPDWHPLLYGQAQAFDNINMARLASAAVDNLIQQITGQDDYEKLIRLLPGLAPIPSLCLPLPTAAPSV